MNPRAVTALRSPKPETALDLYQTDLQRWLFENARLLREGRFDELDAFPDRCPYTPEQILSHEYLPDA
ncbi:hypothetical protein [Candidatus Thiodictyon syntrophicum]|jgi:hypothetical protein|uniref:hypothetical protein n=1 Tax=Candidatus Thiodictyon syntrophicum TaxID=1166950 RepID=UPI0012FD6762|nr:hypothetical protein [Candidatus Thiodictyon syntrophicum]